MSRAIHGIGVGLRRPFAREILTTRRQVDWLEITPENWVRFDQMFAGIACFAVLGFVSDRILLAVRRRLLRGHLIGTEEQVAP